MSPLNDKQMYWRSLEELNDTPEYREQASKEAGKELDRLAKELVDLALDLPADAGLSRANVAQQRIFDSADLQEGANAFFEKRAPRFSGR